MPADPTLTSGLGDLVALVTRQLGYFPTESVVVMSLRPGSTPDRVRNGVLLRLDLAQPDTVDMAQVHHSIARYLRDDHASSAFVVTFSTDQQPATGVRESYAAALRDLMSLALVHTWHVDDEAARCVGDCPAGPCEIPIEQLREVGAFFTASGKLAETRAELGMPTPDPEVAARAKAGAAAWAGAHIADGAVDPHAVRSLWRALLDGVPDSRPVWPETLGELVASITTTTARDIAFTELVAALALPGGGQLDSGDSAQLATSWLVSSDPDVARAPDEALVRAVIDVLRDAAAHCPAPARARALSLAGVMAWWAGLGAQAHVLIDQALEAAPSDRFAALIGQALNTAMPPGWVRAAR